MGRLPHAGVPRWGRGRPDEPGRQTDDSLLPGAAAGLPRAQGGEAGPGRRGGRGRSKRPGFWCAAAARPSGGVARANAQRGDPGLVRRVRPPRRGRHRPAQPDARRAAEAPRKAAQGSQEADLHDALHARPQAG